MCYRLFQVSAPSQAPPLTADARPVSNLRASVMSLRQRWVCLTPPINYLYVRSIQTPLLAAGVPTAVIPERYTSLNYTLLKHDLLSLPNVSKCAILQALRWVRIVHVFLIIVSLSLFFSAFPPPPLSLSLQRLSRSVPGPQREAVIKEYVQNDLLSLRTDLNFTAVSTRFVKLPSHFFVSCFSIFSFPFPPLSSPLSQTLLSSDVRVKESFCRLLNSLSSLRQGRDYLQHSQHFVHSLCVLLMSLQDDDHLLKNLLGTVQKLSLRYCIG